MDVKDAVLRVIWSEAVAPLIAEDTEFDSIMDEALSPDGVGLEAVKDEIRAALDDNDINFANYAEAFEVDAADLEKAVREWLDLPEA